MIEKIIYTPPPPPEINIGKRLIGNYESLFSRIKKYPSQILNPVFLSFKLKHSLITYRINQTPRRYFHVHSWGFNFTARTKYHKNKTAKHAEHAKRE